MPTHGGILGESGENPELARNCEREEGIEEPDPDLVRGASIPRCRASQDTRTVLQLVQERFVAQASSFGIFLFLFSRNRIPSKPKLPPLQPRGLKTSAQEET